MDERQALQYRAARGDVVAFETLVRDTKAGLYRFVRRYVGDADETYDLVQEAYAAAWLAIHRYEPERSFEAWLRTIAINKCRDWSRRRNIRRLFTGSTDLHSAEALAVPDDEAGAEDQYDAAEQAQRLHAAIAALPPKLKEPLLLTAIEERSHAEAAEILGLSAKAVEMRVARARQKLSQHFRVGLAN
ncbi:MULTISPECIES: RNA polymerase sigma factor [Brevundimonas]|uniref:RNA polymerase sigma factor n=1 Tax=Brevundimonas sp. TaxID=1871086 RepID=UPI0025B8335D|nr:RNA polymerase sigma factor [Brevundimonas sp.]MCG2662718.1 RNA polymerase sigma factor [Brevundimonas sp.]